MYSESSPLKDWLGAEWRGLELFSRGVRTMDGAKPEDRDVRPLEKTLQSYAIRVAWYKKGVAVLGHSCDMRQTGAFCAVLCHSCDIRQTGGISVQSYAIRVICDKVGH